MVTTKHKILSVILCIMLAVSAICVGTMAVSAASGDTVYVRANNGWSNLHCYMWNSDSDKNAAWPGVKMTQVEGDVYSYTLTGNHASIIFNNGNGGTGNQTGDMSYPGNGKIYDLASGSWSDYNVNPTTPNPTTPNPTNPVNPGNGITVYCNNEAKWSTVYCYMWNSESDKNATWPGVAMTDIGNGVFSYTSSKQYSGVIFTAGNSGPQTDDLTTAGHDGYVFNNNSKTWEVYDTNPIRVSSFTADPSSDIYVGTDVAISTSATSTSGAAVSYEITVTGSNGVSTVVTNYGPTSAGIWTPTATGTYTVNFKYKDSTGNTNERSLTLTVADDSSLVKPVIKSVFPYNLNTIKTGTPLTVSVKAGGGKTGTNLLFYKYVVTDPSNGKNTAYYTLNDSYNFTPNSNGTYTVEVFVEGSDNSRVNKTYTYTASQNGPTQPVIPTQPPTILPTTVKPTTPVGTKGDTNGDGGIDVNDVTYLQMALARYTGVSVTLETGDICEDGILDVVDATYLQYMLVGIAV